MSARYPIGIQSFAEIRTKNYLYIDKTRFIPMLMESGKHYFLCRPRRFGKSLFISTLEAWFRGQRNLFEGLQAAPEEGESYPVIHLDFAGDCFIHIDTLANYVAFNLKETEKRYGLRDRNPLLDPSPGLMLSSLIARLREETGKQVVLLIDEYDKPLLDAYGNRELEIIYRQQLNSLYAQLKTHDKDIAFSMLTGVTRYGKLNIFSGFNNPREISFSRDFASICGITESELASLPVDFHPFAQSLGLSKDELVGKLKEHYGGYLFAENCERVINPFSLMNSLADKDLRSYWFATATPALLIKMLNDTHYDPSALTCEPVTQNRLLGLFSERDPLPLFYQSGYLTIDRVVGDHLYTMRFPNEDVKRGITFELVPQYLNMGVNSVESLAYQLINAYNQGDIEQIMLLLTGLLYRVPYHLRPDERDREAYYHALLYIVTLLSGVSCHAELPSANGRLDMFVATQFGKAYVFEFKMSDDSSHNVAKAHEAMRQIEHRGYAHVADHQTKELYLIGAAFDPTTKTIGAWTMRCPDGRVATMRINPTSLTPERVS